MRSTTSVSVSSDPGRAPGRVRKRVLFVGQRGDVRAAMAAAFARHYARLRGKDVEVELAALRPAERVHPIAERLMAEKGLTLPAPRALDMLELEEMDLAVIVCDGPGHACSLLQDCPIGTTECWSVPDPEPMRGSSFERERLFRAVRVELEFRARDLIETL